MGIFVKAVMTFLLLAVALPVAARDVSRIPVAETVSPQLRQNIEAGQMDWWHIKPQNTEEWKKFQHDRDSVSITANAALREKLQVHVEKSAMGGVPVFVLTPKELPQNHADKILLYVHGGGYVLGAGEAGLGEGLYMAALGGFKVVSVDYRMPPEFPCPAALEDSLAVYRALLKKYQPANIGVFGSSAGGGLTLALPLAAKRDGLPLPGAIAPGTPWADLTKTGDSYFTNEHLDNVLVGYDGWLAAAARSYAHGRDLRDPFLSPVYADVSGFPPTILGTGTRDLFLSNTVRMHRKLREAQVPAELLVMEGLPHAGYYILESGSPESRYYFTQVADFFDRHLGK